MSINVGLATGYLDLDISGFVSKLDMAHNEAIRKTNGLSTQLSSALKGVGGQLERTGKTLTYGVTLPIVGAFAAATKSAIDYESAFTGVRKTVNATEEEFAALSKGIRDMAKEIPQSASAIAYVMELAGQLGIENEALLDFTRVMIDLGEATNLSAESGAMQLARFATITQMSQKDFDRLGATIVDLGNNFNATESEIVDMAMNLAGVGTQVGLTEAEIMGLATSLTSVGMESAAGGTAFSRLMVRMGLAADIGDRANQVIDQTGYSLRDLRMMSSHSSKDFGNLAESMGYTKEELERFVDSAEMLEGFTRVTGIAGDEFKQAFQEDAAGAIQMFIKGLQEAGENGESVISILDDMGFREVRIRDAIMRSVGAGELMAGTIDLATKAWGENTALTEEAGRRYETTASHLKIMKNNLVDAGMTLMEGMLPALKEVSDYVVELVNKFMSLSEGTRNFIVKALLAAAAIGPILLIVGKLTKTFGFLIDAFMKVGRWVKITNALLAAKGTSLMALLAPVLKVAGVVGVLVAAFVNLWKKDSDFRQRMTDGWNKLVGFFSDFIEGIKERFSGLSEAIGNVINFIRGMWDAFTVALMPVFDVAWAAIVNTLGVALDIITGILDIFIGIFTGNWSQVWEGVKGIFVGIWDGIVGFITDILTIIQDYFGEALEAIVTWVSELPGNIAAFFAEVWASAIEWGANMWEAAKETGSNFLDAIIEFFTDLPYKVGFFIGETLAKIALWAIDVWEKAKETGRNFINAIVEFFRTLPGKVREWTSTTYSNIKTWASDIWSKAKEAGKNFVDGLIDWFKKLPGRVKEWLVDTIGKVRQWASDLKDKGKQAASDLVDAVIEGVKSLPGKMLQFGVDVVQGFWQGIVELGGWIRSKVRGFFNGIVDGVKSALRIGSPSKVFEDVAYWSVTGFGDKFTSMMPKVGDDIDESLHDAIDGIEVDADFIDYDNLSGPERYAAKIKEIFGSLQKWLQSSESNILEAIQNASSALDHMIDRIKSLSTISLNVGALDGGVLTAPKPLFAGFLSDTEKALLSSPDDTIQGVKGEVIDYVMLANILVDALKAADIKVDSYLNLRKVTDEVNEENARRKGRRL